MTDTIPLGYTLFAVLALPRPRHGAPDAAALEDLTAAVAVIEADGVTLRGLYDVTGMRGEADLLVWLHTGEQTPLESPAVLQQALRTLRRTAVLAGATAVWTAVGVHREAEFNKRHVPGYLRGEHARGWLCVYPFVRSYEWYLLPDEERSAMLAEHGRKGARFTDVVANTVSTFGLSDYEWLLPLESDDPIHLVDMMRDLRATGARRHVREEVPFYTGRRIEVADLAEVLKLMAENLTEFRPSRRARAPRRCAATDAGCPPPRRRPAPATGSRRPRSPTMPCCCSASAVPRGRTMSSRSSATSRPVAASPTNGSRRSRITTATSAACRRSTITTAS